jgi:hypothetical protein
VQLLNDDHLAGIHRVQPVRGGGRSPLHPDHLRADHAVGVRQDPLLPADRCQRHFGTLIGITYFLQHFAYFCAGRQHVRHLPALLPAAAVPADHGSLPQGALSADHHPHRGQLFADLPNLLHALGHRPQPSQCHPLAPQPQTRQYI